jgi:hypothetical protein
MTLEQIVDATGVGTGTVHRALDNNTAFPDGKADSKPNVKGKDGKSYPMGLMSFGGKSEKFSLLNPCAHGLDSSRRHTGVTMFINSLRAWA